MMKFAAQKRKNIGTVSSVQVLNKKTANHTCGYVLLDLNSPLPAGDNIYLSYEEPETGALQDMFGNKVKTHGRIRVSEAAAETTVVISDDQNYMCVTMPISGVHTDFKDVEIWINNEKLSSNQVHCFISIDRITAYTKLNTSVVSAGALVVKATGEKILYNAAEEAFQSLIVSNVYTEETIGFVHPVYNLEEKTLYIEVNGMDNRSGFNSLNACDFMIEAAGKEYRMRGRVQKRSSDGTWNFVFVEDCLKHISGFDEGSFKIKYSPLLPQEGFDSPYASGKPMGATDYMDVTIESNDTVFKGMRIHEAGQIREWVGDGQGWMLRE